jgi:hypothetical protein
MPTSAIIQAAPGWSPAWVAISEGRRDGVRAVDAVGVDGALLLSIDARPQ